MKEGKKLEGVDRTKTSGNHFSKALLKWNEEENRRKMPWKGEKDPYKIWLSEIILQQTRVEQGLDYYNRFVATFPTINDLANAPEQQVFKLWEGLGYYSRCRNLIATAKYIATELNGVFPTDYPSILSLKGIGPYTAAAISSFAYNLPYAVLDGNVFRVLSRIQAIDTPVDSTEGKKEFTSLAESLLAKKQSAAYNQAIMDFGATICKPLPECGICFYKNHCAAYLEGKQLLFPVKTKKTSVKERWFNYVIVKHHNKVAIRERTDKDIWQNLFEFVLIETDQKPKTKELLIQLEKNLRLTGPDYTYISEDELDQRLSHQLIHFRFFQLSLKQPISTENYQWISVDQLKDYPFPKSLQQYIKSSIS